MFCVCWKGSRWFQFSKRGPQICTYFDMTRVEVQRLESTIGLFPPWHKIYFWFHRYYLVEVVWGLTVAVTTDYMESRHKRRWYWPSSWEVWTPLTRFHATGQSRRLSRRGHTKWTVYAINLSWDFWSLCHETALHIKQSFSRQHLSGLPIMSRGSIQNQNKRGANT